jgi:uncharacterized tellurite resistance protein B-like protein
MDDDATNPSPLQGALLLLAAIAWADGTIQIEERAALSAFARDVTGRIAPASLGMAGDVDVGRWVDVALNTARRAGHPVAFASEVSARMNRSQREETLRLCVMMMAVDAKLALEEARRIEQVATGLGFTSDELIAIVEGALT